ncbi:MAG TPA: glycosyltransferase, partial [Thermoanaerobaculia bacterium]|nr:glycosyltransferase [Thermoanaerobaculia bacterium]
MPPDGRRTVFVDFSTLPPDGSSGGAARFTLRLLAALSSRSDAHRYHVLTRRETAPALEPLRGSEVEIEVLGEAVSEPRFLRRRLRRMPRSLSRLVPDTASLRRRGAEVLFSPLFTALFHEPGLPHLVIAYDFQELRFPRFFAKGELMRRHAFRRDLLRADRVVAISSETKRDAVEKAGLEAERVRVVPPVVGPARIPLDEGDQARLLGSLRLTAGSYAAYPANYWPHKNHERLLAALVRARQRRPELSLVLCGALEAHRNWLIALARNCGLSEAVRVFPYLSDDEVTA